LKAPAADLKPAKVVNQALRSGASVETVLKAAAGTNKKASSAAVAAPAHKLDETTDPRCAGSRGRQEKRCC
jgi:putative transcription factor